MKKYICSFLLLLLSVFAIAQDTIPTEQPSGMRSEGKIYVVVAVVLTIFLGLILYVIRLDRKITKLEKKNG
ncbi:MAG: CcmD family protein [Flavitalea sp.]